MFTPVMYFNQVLLALEISTLVLRKLGLYK